MALFNRLPSGRERDGRKPCGRNTDCPRQRRDAGRWIHGQHRGTGQLCGARRPPRAGHSAGSESASPSHKAVA